MTERFKEGQIVGLVYSEEFVHRKKLKIRLAIVGHIKDDVVIKIPDDIGIQYIFPELSSILDPKNAKL